MWINVISSWEKRAANAIWESDPPFAVRPCHPGTIRTEEARAGNLRACLDRKARGGSRLAAIEPETIRKPTATSYAVGLPSVNEV
jgi:hypothetical protein